MTDSQSRYTLDDYDYELPEHLIAQEPASQRDGSRLLVLDRENSTLSHKQFPDLLSFIRPGDLLVRNTTKVIPARVFGHRETTKGKAEILLLSPHPLGWELLLKTRGKPQVGEYLAFASGKLRLRLLEKGERGHWVGALSTPDNKDPMAILEQVGTMPLPPYIKREAGEDAHAPMDKERYQTVFAKNPGAVAAPTAGLHFTEGFFESLKEIGAQTCAVTLHVGLGTFQPIEAEDYRDHNIHGEVFEVNESTAALVNQTRAQGGRVFAIGTTALRSLESAWDESTGKVVAKQGTTHLFIYPPKQVRSIDCLVTNFHLPRSSLMLLIAAFAGRERIMDAYRQAVQREYRFFSYGDAMLIT